MPLFTFRLAEHLDTLTRDQLLSARSQLPGFDTPDRHIKKAELAAAVEAALTMRISRSSWSTTACSSALAAAGAVTGLWSQPTRSQPFAVAHVKWATR
jgi:hypothetical protein